MSQKVKDLKYKKELELISSAEVAIAKILENVDIEPSLEDLLIESREHIERLKNVSKKLQSGAAFAGSENDSFSSTLKNAALNFNAISPGFDSVRLARQGLPKKVLIGFAKKMSLTIQELANVIHISERTLQRYDDNEIVRPEYAEKAIELARLYNRGEEVFDSIEKFKLWMKSPSFVFNGESPISLLDTSAGFDMVFKELGRIEYGIFA